MNSYFTSLIFLALVSLSLGYCFSSQQAGSLNNYFTPATFLQLAWVTVTHETHQLVSNYWHKLTNVLSIPQAFSELFFDQFLKLLIIR